MNGQKFLLTAGVLSFIAALLHVMTVFGGPDWYRFFGAGEAMAQLAAAGSWYPTIITFAIASVLVIWGLYALSGAGVIRKLPLLMAVLIFITSVFLFRGLAGLVLPFVVSHPLLAQNTSTFWLVSSVICLLIGLMYLLGVLQMLKKASKNS